MGFAYWLFVQQSAWIAAGISLYMTWAMGSYRWWSPLLGLVNQVFWVILGLYTGQYGLLVSATGFSIVHGRNALKWWRERRKLELQP